MAETKTAGKTSVYIRWMLRRDMEEVLDIERASFEYPWSEKDFICCLRQRQCVGQVAEHDGHVAGFIIYDIHRTRFHLLNLAVRQCRHGIGTALIDELKHKLRKQCRNRIVLEVRETNVDAQLFFRSHGFLAISILHGFYDDTPDAAYLFQWRLPR